MNERIKQLAASHFPRDGEGEIQATPEIIAEFAEAIVLACLSNMENCDGDLDFAIWKTKEDFGVE